MIVILGAGLAGLSAAYSLRGRDYRLFEQESRPGGLARSEERDGFCFDHAGHVLHFRDPELRSWCLELLGDNWAEHQRRAAIFSQRVLTPYPFQANTFGLPAETVLDCVTGFVEARLAAERKIPPPDDFAGWIRHTFGEGFARHFFFPFNEKLWRRELAEITADWVSWSIPRPSVREVVAGALGVGRTTFGYNAGFIYPRRGGIESLSRALAAQVKVETGRKVVEVHPQTRQVVLQSGEKVGYGRLITTLPLKTLLERMRGLPPELAEAGRGLQYISVFCINVGFRGPEIPDLHWVYFPEAEFPFYRAGFYSNYSDGPADRHAVVLEVSSRPERLADLSGAFLEEGRRALAGAGFISPEHRVEHLSSLTIPCGYVVFDRHRQKALPKIFAYLAAAGIYSAGRYARWEYGTMTDALAQGRAAAREAAG